MDRFALMCNFQNNICLNFEKQNYFELLISMITEPYFNNCDGIFISLYFSLFIRIFCFCSCKFGLICTK